MAKKRRSSQFKESSQVIDIEEARKKRQEKRKKQQREQEQAAESRNRTVRASVKARRLKKNIVYAVIILFIIAAIGASIMNILSFKADYNEAKEQNEQLTQQKKELQEQIKSSDQKDFIEKEAREQLHMVNPGETVYIVPFTEEQTEAAKEDE